MAEPELKTERGVQVTPRLLDTRDQTRGPQDGVQLGGHAALLLEGEAGVLRNPLLLAGTAVLITEEQVVNREVHPTQTVSEKKSDQM